MDESNKERMTNVPVSREARLPEGYDLETLCAIKGRWPKRELSQEELLDTYKSFYSSRNRSETLLVLQAFEERFGPDVRAVVDEIYYKLGKEAGIAEKAQCGSLLSKLVDMFARPHSYENEHLETSEERIVVKVLKCPFADLAKELGLENISRHICLPWHRGYSEVYGYTCQFSKLLLAGDDCCHQTWEKQPSPEDA